MTKEYQGPERRKNCDGCTRTDLLEERRASDNKLDDVRWKSLKNMGKAIVVIFGLTGGGIGILLHNMSASLLDLTVAIRTSIAKQATSDERQNYLEAEQKKFNAGLNATNSEVRYLSKQLDKLDNICLKRKTTGK